ncbi:RQC domain-containing protein [Nonomuraea sp. NPDC055795]
MGDQPWPVRAVAGQPHVHAAVALPLELLDYFGEKGTAPCGNCDTCQTPPETWDATVPAQKVLSTVLRLARERGQKFGVGQAVDILLGKKTAKVEQFGHDTLTVFGIGTELTGPEWHGVVRQLLAQGILAVEPAYGALVLTDESAGVLRGQQKVSLRRDLKPRTPSRSGGGSSKSREVVDLTPEAAPRFERLRAWRAATAKETGVPAYVIFHDATLREIATRNPTTLPELGTVSGVGENKLAKFGPQVLETLHS